MQQFASTYQPFNSMSDTTTKREFTLSDQSNPNQITRGSKQNASIVENRATESKNAEDAKEMKQMSFSSHTTRKTKRRRQTKIQPKTRLSDFWIHRPFR